MRILVALLLLIAPAQAQHSQHGEKRALNFATISGSTVAGLGACAAGNNGQISKVSDALTPVVGAVVGGGGAVSVLVHCQSGTGWVVG